MRYIGGGHKRMYRVIDFLRDKDNYSATVKTIEYDPNRSARIALVVYEDGEKRYIIAPEGLQVGQTISSGSNAAPEIGNTLFLSDIPLGTLIHNIELKPGRGRHWPAAPDLMLNYPLMKENMLLLSFLRARRG